MFSYQKGIGLVFAVIFLGESHIPYLLFENIFFLIELTRIVLDY